MAAVTFKRKELINAKLKLVFALFAISAFFIITFFVLEDYLHDYIAIKKFIAYNNDTLNQPLKALCWQYSSLFEFLKKPLNLSVLIIFVVSYMMFASIFKPRLKPMFRLFFWISLIMIIVFHLWSVFLIYALSNPNNKVVVLLAHLPYSNTSKVILLIAWSYLSFYISYLYVTTKFLSIFLRIDYLFKSILRGNWDAIMFFRIGDSFDFLAPTFNKLKDSSLSYLHKTDNLLIHIKDKLDSDQFSSQIKEEIKKDLEEMSV